MEELGKILKRTLAQKNISESMATPPDETEPEDRKCPVCRGHGWVVLDVTIDHPDFGKSFPCECTLRELARGRTDRLERYSNVGPLRRLKFDNIQPEGLDSNPYHQTQYRSCYDEARAFSDQPRGWLVITGPSGCGKTHIAAAIANHCIDCGRPAFWTIVPDLLDHLRATFAPNSDVTYDELFERVKNAPLLILDDLGTHSSTAWAEEKLFQVLNHRFNAELPTVVTTIDLDTLDERLRTRLLSPGLSEEIKLKTTGPPVFTQIGGISQEIMSSMRFRNFDVMGMNADVEARDSLKKALQATQEFAEAPADWLVLVGPAGSGKTHLAAAITNRQINSSRPVVFASVSELLEGLRAGSKGDSKRTAALNLNDIKNSSLLILDDLSVETETAWGREKLYQILNFRYNARLATVITATNPGIESLDARMWSRLNDPKISNVVPIGAPDFRGQDKRPKSPRKKQR
ncbi:MAG: ATP-binding protein [Dehalococcoidia bacterium]